MTAKRLWDKLGQLADRESLSPDLGRALRCMVGYMAPLCLALAGRLPLEVAFAAFAGQNIATVDVRGAYSLRFTLLISMTAVIAGAAALGALAGTPLALALSATLLIAILTGLWRHLSSDYGPSLAVASSLAFFIAVAVPGGAEAAKHHALAVLFGGTWGCLLQVALWPLRPQHPLRVAVADGWLAAADLFSVFMPGESETADARQQRIAEREANLRTVMEKTYSVLSAASAKRPGPLARKLEGLNSAAGRLATQVSALDSARDALTAEPEYAALAPSFLPLLVSLNNTARGVALTVVSRQPGHLAAAEVRMRRLSNLLQSVGARVRAQSGASSGWTQVGEILRQIEELVPRLRDLLRDTIDRADERAAFSLELFDLQTLTLRPLASALNFSTRVDPALLRYTLRIAVLTLIGVTVMKLHPMAHGYWLPFTMVVVLQPDYGATRQKAVQRLAGTLVGSIFASLVLWFHLPFAALMTVIAAMSFVFGYYLKRNYGVAVVFITLFVILLLESTGPLKLEFALERLGSTTAGGALALLAALLFWPTWERNRIGPFIARALRSNGAYLGLVSQRIVAGGRYDREVVRAKRTAESASSALFSSLQRMWGDPKNQQLGIEQNAALANSNARLIRAVNLLALHLTPGASLPGAGIENFADCARAALEALALAAEHPPGDPIRLGAVRAAIESLRLPLAHSAMTDAPGTRHRDWVLTQLARAGTELGAMLLNAETAGAPN